MALNIRQLTNEQVQTALSEKSPETKHHNSKEKLPLFGRNSEKIGGFLFAMINIACGG